MPWCPGIKPKFLDLAESNRQTPELDWPTRMEINLSCSKTQCPQHSAASSCCVAWCCMMLHGVAWCGVLSFDGFQMLDLFDTWDTRAVVIRNTRHVKSIARQADFDFVIPRTQTFSFRTASWGSGVKEC